jgi:hypothetical protein
MAWITTFNGISTGPAYWVYNAGSGASGPTGHGMQRNSSVTPLLNGTLIYTIPTLNFKSTKMYQYEVTVKGNFTGIGLSAGFQWSQNSIYNGANRKDSIIGLNTGAGARYFFYSSPNANNLTANSIFLYATGSLSGDNSTSPRITNLKINEIDWRMSGTSRYSNGVTSSLNDPSYSGWSYEASPNTDNLPTFWWAHRPSPIMGATGLQSNNNISTNFITKTVPYAYYNLSFGYVTSGGTYSDGLKIYQGTDYNNAISAGPLYTLTQSSSSTSSTYHQVYGLQGNGQSIFIVGSTTSIPNGFISGVVNPIVSGGYHPNNNQQFLFTNGSLYSNPTQLQILGTATNGMTFSFIVGSGSTITGTPSNLNLINALFGNGTFKSGVWENGVWNSGWRVDTEIFEFDSVGVAFRTIADRRWRIQLTGPSSSGTQFNIGERISISNIVAIDINETRKLLKGYFTIINKSDTSLIVETDVSFPFRRIEKDSENHKIKVTKNVWLNGAFLNGYYTGIWNYGLFKGFPRITEMFDTHWIDGIFDGGHFNSKYETYNFVDTYYITGSLFGLNSTFDGKLGLSFSAPHGYIVGDKININKSNKSINPKYDGNTNVIAVIDDHLLITDKIFGSSSTLEGGISSNTKANGLIQNFKFFDNNIAGKVSSQSPGSSEPVFQFNSWVDVNYYNTSAVNIGKPVKLYDSNSKLEYTQNNLYGYPTNDILSSISSFRDSYSFNIRNYKLGTKYKIYQDPIGNESTFEKPFNMDPEFLSYTFSIKTVNTDTQYSTFSALVGDARNPSFIGLGSFMDSGWTFSGTNSTYERSVEDVYYNSITTEDLNIKGEELIIRSQASGSLLNNSNIQIENNRYTVVELDIKSYSLFSPTQSSAYHQAGSTQSILNGYPNTEYPVSNIHPIPVLNFNNINQFKQTSFFNLGVLGSFYITIYQPMTYLPIYENINHLLTPGIKKYEYFYNKPTLSMKTLGGDDLGNDFDLPSDIEGRGTINGYYQSKIILDNLKYYEIDMIPFFQYFTFDNIYKGVSVPWQGIAPFIDYTNSNFSFIDNIIIGMGSVQTSQSFTPVSGVGISVGLNSNTTTYLAYENLSEVNFFISNE